MNWIKSVEIKYKNGETSFFDDVKYVEMSADPDYLFINYGSEKEFSIYIKKDEILYIWNRLRKWREEHDQME